MIGQLDYEDGMPVCKMCAHNFPYRVNINGKVKNLCKRKYCLTCSPWGKHNTRKIESKPKNNDTTSTLCTDCGKSFSSTRGNAKCQACWNKHRRHALKIKAIEYKGGKCCRCGYNRSKSAMEFHHVHPEEKDMNFSQAISYSWDQIEKELNKCILVCANCHREEHDKMNEQKKSR